MQGLIYALMCLPAVLMTVAGIALSSAKRDSTIANHHHARNFNIKKYSKKIVPLFTVSGIFFSLGGVLVVSNVLFAGLAVMFITLLVFIIAFALIQKNM